MPCGNCNACMMNDCGECKFCLDKRKFGGPGKLKKRCELRTCVIPSDRKPGEKSVKTIRVNKTPYGGAKEPKIRNKFLSSVDLDDVGDMNTSFEDSFGGFGANSIDDSPSPPETSSAASLQSFIYGGLVDGENGETYEVVEVIQAEDKPCYICKSFTSEDLFYCSSCYDPYHQCCLQMQHLPQPKGVNSSGSMCGRCINSKNNSYEQDMNTRANSIDAKCEEINGKQYQVISFLTEPDNDKLAQDCLNLEGVDPWEMPSFGLQSLNDLPGTYDMDFDKYLQTNGLAISLQE